MTPLPLNALPPPSLKITAARCLECGHDNSPAPERCPVCGAACAPPTTVARTGRVLFAARAASGDFALFEIDSGQRLVAPLALKQPRPAPGARGRLALRRGDPRPAGGEADNGVYYIFKIVVAAALPARQENA